MKNFMEKIAEVHLLNDGAMGTQLQQAGLTPGSCGELWNLEAPDKVLAIQQAYVEVGSNCLTTNTFGGCRIALARHGLGDQVEEINQAAVRIARNAFDGGEGYVIGDIGPFGGLMEPYGDVSPDEVREAFLEQAAALVSAGADVVIVETQTSLDELKLGLRAAREAKAPCVIGSVAFDVTHDGSDVRTMMGVDPERAAKFMENEGADILAMNCGTGVDMVWAARILERYGSVSSSPLMAQPNAGAPVLEGTEIVYKQTPEEMAAGVPELLKAGARVIGGCCGSTPSHIRALRQALDRFEAAGN